MLPDINFELIFYCQLTTLILFDITEIPRAYACIKKKIIKS